MNNGRRVVRGVWIGLCLWLGFAACSSAAEVLREINWSGNEPKGAMVLPPDAGFSHSRLLVDNKAGKPITKTLLELMRPGVTTKRYALTGQLRYQGVTKPSYLEMQNYIPGHGAFYTRSLADEGPLRTIEGNSGWRTFILPFELGEAGVPPNRIELKLVLDGPGHVELGPVTLLQFTPEEDPLQLPGVWWSERSAGLVGGLVGAFMGLLGALVGYLGSKGRGRGFVMFVLKGFMLVGVLCLGAGALAWHLGQPYAVVYPLLLFGVLGLVLPAFNLKALQRRYTELEMRRIRAEDARSG